MAAPQPGPRAWGRRMRRHRLRICLPWPTRMFYDDTWWDQFYADRRRPVPFFVAAPDESPTAGSA